MGCWAESLGSFRGSSITTSVHKFSQHGPSPVVRGAIPATDFEALNAFVKRSGKKQSAIVREAIHEYLVERKLVS